MSDYAIAVTNVEKEVLVRIKSVLVRRRVSKRFARENRDQSFEKHDGRSIGRKYGKRENGRK